MDVRRRRHRFDVRDGSVSGSEKTQWATKVQGSSRSQKVPGGLGLGLGGEFVSVVFLYKWLFS